MRAHAKSDAHILYSVAEVLAAKAGSILQQLRSVTEEQRIKKTGRVLSHLATPLSLVSGKIYWCECMFCVSNNSTFCQTIVPNETRFSGETHSTSRIDFSPNHLGHLATPLPVGV